MTSAKLLNQCDGCGAMLFPNNKPTGWAALAVRYRKRAKAWKALAKQYRTKALLHDINLKTARNLDEMNGVEPPEPMVIRGKR